MSMQPAIPDSSTPSHAEPSSSESQGRRGRHCRTCSFDCRSLINLQLCPECGTPHAPSLAAPLLSDLVPASGFPLIQSSRRAVVIALVLCTVIDLGFTILSTLQQFAGVQIFSFSNTGLWMSVSFMKLLLVTGASAYLLLRTRLPMRRTLIPCASMLILYWVPEVTFQLRSAGWLSNSQFTAAWIVEAVAQGFTSACSLIVINDLLMRVASLCEDPRSWRDALLLRRLTLWWIAGLVFPRLALNIAIFTFALPPAPIVLLSMTAFYCFILAKIALMTFQAIAFMRLSRAIAQTNLN